MEHYRERSSENVESLRSFALFPCKDSRKPSTPFSKQSVKVYALYRDERCRGASLFPRLLMRPHCRKLQLASTPWYIRPIYPPTVVTSPTKCNSCTIGTEVDVALPGGCLTITWPSRVSGLARVLLNTFWIDFAGRNIQSKGRDQEFAQVRTNRWKIWSRPLIMSFNPNVCRIWLYIKVMLLSVSIP